MSQGQPATVAQLEIWLAEQREPDSARWLIPVDLEFTGAADDKALRAVLGDVIRRHPQLRSGFTIEDGSLRRLESDAAMSFRVHRREGPYSRAEALERAAALGGRPLAIDSPPLVRADLLAYDDGALLALKVHHIVADGWSVDVLCRHLVEAYAARSAGRPPTLPSQAVQGGGPGALDGTDEDRAAAAAHWARITAGGHAALSPLPDYVTADPFPGPARHVSTLLVPGALGAIRTFADRELTSSAVILLTAWCLLLHLHSGLDDGVVALPFSGRNDETTHEEIGLYARLLPVRSQLSPAQSFLGMLRGMREQAISSLEWSEEIDSLRGMPAAQPGRAVFAYYLVQDTSWQVGETAIQVVRHPTETAKHALALACTEQADQMELRIDYDADVYREDTARLLLDQMIRLVTEAVDRPDASCRALACALAGQPARPASPAAQPLPQAAVSLPSLVREQAAARPDAIAITDGQISLSYRQLVARADALARWLARRGAGPGGIVALMLPAGTDTIVAMLGASLAGAAYLPLDAGYPDAQLTVILSSAGPCLLLTERDAKDRVTVENVAVHVLSDALADALADPAPAAESGSPGSVPGVVPGPQDVFNILYTSGSTGRPKGVVLPHAGMARLMQRPDFLPLGPDDVVSQLSPLNFDGATYEIWGALTHGAQLVILPRELVLSPRDLRDAIRRNAVTTLLVTTPLLNRIIEDAPDILQTVRRVYFGGELVSVPHLRRAVGWAGPNTLLHSYGPTENSFTSTWWQVDEIDRRARTLPIGEPVPGTSAYVVFDGSYDLVPPGVPGELLLGGAGLAFGYLGDPRGTAASFIPDPYSDVPGSRLYRTGDRVRVTPAGLLEFVGRNDNQIKIRSQRVELGEVETALLAHDGVESAFVTARADHDGMKQIVAYLTLAGQVTIGDVRAHLRRLLPAFAVPAHLVVLDELPVTANGKIDRARLPEPGAARVADPAGPATPASRTSPGTAPVAGPAAGAELIRAAWREVLAHDRFGDDENFFDVGGHSLLLVTLQDALRRHAGRAPSIAELLRHTTVRAHAGLPTGAPAVSTTRNRDPGPAADDRIAIIGMACRFGGADDVWELWDRLASGRDGMTRAAGPLVTELANGARRIARYGALRETAFDGDLFGLAGGTADPQYGLMYECLWAAAENAALRMADTAGRTSVYLGCSRARRQQPGGSDVPLRADDVVGTDPTFLPTRFSYWYDLKGESMLIDTACSTSLVAVHLACQSLLSGRSDYAFAGGVSIQAPADPSYLYLPGQIYAADGYCRPHDRRASGTVPGDGAGAVLLRRLSDALRDGDPVYAVIMGSAVNNDGNVKIGYSAPGVDGQAQVIRDAMAAARLSGAEIDYVEAHGTGTRMGDTIEAIALTEALGPDGPPVAVGSVKATVGHTDAAAGVAGLIKTALAIYHSYVPATPGVGEPIEELSRFGDRFGQVPDGMPWPSREHPRTAGVSSFGVGGTNAHVVLREPPRPAGPGTAASSDVPAPRIAGLAARSLDGLARQSARLAAYLADHPELPLADVATTLAVGREFFRVRRAVVAPDSRSLAAALAGGPEPASGTFVAEGLASPGGGRCLVVLGDPPARPAGPGQSGSLPAARRRLDQARSLLEPGTGLPAAASYLSWQVGVVEQLRAWQVDIADVRGQGLGERARRVLTGLDDFAETVRAATVSAAAAGGSSGGAGPGDAGLPVARPGVAGLLVARPGVAGLPGAVPLVVLVVGTADPLASLQNDEQVAATVELDEQGGGGQALLRAVAELWCQGVQADLTLGLPGARRHLPGQAFERGAGSGNGQAAAATVPPADSAPLTHLQQRLLFQDVVRIGSAAEHHVAAGCVVNEVDLRLLRDCLGQIQCDDPRLRTFFRRFGDQWRSCVAAGPRVPLQVDAAWAAQSDGRTDDSILRLGLCQPLGLVDDVPMNATLVNRPGGGGLVVLAAYRGIIDLASLTSALHKAMLSYSRALAGRDGERAAGEVIRLLAPAGMDT